MTLNTRNAFLPRNQLQTLLDVLAAEGYDCVGPTVLDDVIQYRPISQVSQLPKGISDQQTPGRYRLQHLTHEHFFSWTHSAQGLKPLSFAPREPLWTVQQATDETLEFLPCTPAIKPTAVIGVRACDLAALDLQDRHFLQPDNPDPYYQARRETLLLIAVNCSQSAETCFCVSTGDGPACKTGYDLALTELEDGFVIDAATDQGQAIAARLPLQEAHINQTDQAALSVQRASKQQRRLPEGNHETLLFNNLEHPHWQTVAERCLSCGNCTAVCPTCFCHSEQDLPTLDGRQSTHQRQWDSCFTLGHGHLHGLAIRSDTRTQYRQWLTHKLGSWHSQYGRSGCVGCGRCIVWCPVGIDLTAEMAVLAGAST